jgi:predicted flavoprotein YhiN
MEEVKLWLSSHAANLFEKRHTKTFPDTSASITTVTMLTSSLSKYVFFV